MVSWNRIVPAVAAVLSLHLGIALIGCNDIPPDPNDDPVGPTTEGDKGPEGPTTAKSAFVESDGTSIVVGRVLFTGEVPARATIAMKQECDVLHNNAGSKLDERVVVDDNAGAKTLRNVFVYVSKGTEKWSFKVPSEPVTIDQVGCVYKPHVMGLMAGQVLRIRNSDPLAHNVHYLPVKSREFNFSQNQGAENDATLQRSEILAGIKCDVHSWMKCYVGVTDHPFYGVSDEKGEFRFKTKLPPGKYKLTAVHETGAKKMLDLEVKKDAPEAKIDFTFDRKELR